MGDFDSQLYEERFLMNLDRRTVGREITNSNFTADGARTVQVFNADDLSAPDLNADNSVNLQSPSGGVTPMTLDQEKDLSVNIPTVEEFQSAPDMQEKFRDRQAQALEEDIDDAILGEYTNADASNDVTTSATTASGFGDVVREAKVNLSENDVPRSGRFMVVSPFYADLIAEDAGDRIERNRDIETDGYIGRYQGFDIFETTGLKESGSSPTKQHQLYGHREAITLAIQLNDVNLIPTGSQAVTHGDVLKSLAVYGFKTFLPTALGQIAANKPS